MGSIEVGGVGLSLSVRSESLFEEGCIACDDCGDNVDVGVRPEGGMVVHTVSRMAVGCVLWFCQVVLLVSLW